ncbi:unnamed protein product [Schistosoma mattheei]|uniref:Uncharacterized protein n=1 Tax=Schistosoma mattheei TaxID=31246 RepID=A0A3P8GBH6_9TREM|nr:unnamed protein product [Schistosoma mattheei]
MYSIGKRDNLTAGQYKLAAFWILFESKHLFSLLEDPERSKSDKWKDCNEEYIKNKKLD